MAQLSCSSAYCYANCKAEQHKPQFFYNNIMAHRKNPSALRRRINLSASTFCTYIRKNGLSLYWIKRLGRLQKTKHFTKCGQQTKQINKTIKGHSKTAKKVIFKKTNAVIYFFPFRATIYPVFSKGISFKVFRHTKRVSLHPRSRGKRKARLNREVAIYIYIFIFFFYQAYKDVYLYKINQKLLPF